MGSSSNLPASRPPGSCPRACAAPPSEERPPDANVRECCVRGNAPTSRATTWMPMLAEEPRGAHEADLGNVAVCTLEQLPERVWVCLSERMAAAAAVKSRVWTAETVRRLSGRSSACPDTASRPRWNGLFASIESDGHSPGVGGPWRLLGRFISKVGRQRERFSDDFILAPLDATALVGGRYRTGQAYDLPGFGRFARTVSRRGASSQVGLIYYIRVSRHDEVERKGWFIGMAWRWL